MEFLVDPIAFNYSGCIDTHSICSMYVDPCNPQCYTYCNKCTSNCTTLCAAQYCSPRADEKR